MLDTPVEGVELRHSLREKLQMSSALALLFLAADLAELWLNVHTIKTPLYISLKCLFLFSATYAVMNQQFIRVDSSGISARVFLFTRRVSWHEVSSYAADWSVHFEGLASSYGTASYVGKVTLKGENGKRLLELKVNCGPVQVRKRLKNYMESQLVNRSIAVRSIAV